MRKIKPTPVVNEDTGEIVGWNLQVIWKNAGQTPTRQCVFVVNRGIAPKRLPETYDTFPDAEGQRRQKVLIAPNGFVRSGDFYFSLDELQRVREGKAFCYLFGWIDYNDVFEGTPRHRTEFCVAILIDTDPATKNCDFTFAIFGPLNGHDEDCHRRPEAYDPAAAVAFAP
jgi:hypothetical protein